MVISSVRRISPALRRLLTAIRQRLCVIRRRTCSHDKLKFLAQSCTRTIYQIDKACKPMPTTQLTVSVPLKLRPSILCILASLKQLIVGASVEQNSIGYTQIIISQDFKRIPEGLSLCSSVNLVPRVCLFAGYVVACHYLTREQAYSGNEIVAQCAHRLQ
jgi:hypothetical protein